MAKRQPPELTRTTLLQAATRVIRTHGATLSLDAVAREAGISKGGLLHHYPTKDHLLTALAHALVDQFRDELRAAHASEIATHGDTPGAWLRAYIHVSFTPAQDTELLSTALAPIATLPDLLPDLQAAQAFLITDAQADGLPPGRAHAIRLACDGLWTGHHLGLPDLTNEQRAALKEELLSWTRP
ncbi:TetR/AcrR family transcriptional regulator [Deinococcus humi]|uniref:AcrR family transcriptional regulator n=1 Tax=Deinococcus humi TaxID=662880 RepID=A0A7W8JXG3_9DEIO|nr:TetR/AcrR family transcriptional regulator [Deinococcus humi]MBB5363738.1 AcrR family transcriptional regulator [Deinococcus humi]GGO29544.1 TetR family transcriptional regulator [Deinococcus humi]